MLINKRRFLSMINLSKELVEILDHMFTIFIKINQKIVL